MNGTWRYTLVYALTSMAPLFATSHVVAAPANNLQVLHAFCYPGDGCAEEPDMYGYDAQGIVAGPDGAYYGATVFGGGSIYRADPITRTLQVIYQFPAGSYPSGWLKVGPDGDLYGGFHQTPQGGVPEGLFRLSLAGEFKIIHSETKYTGFACNAPVRDSLGNWIGITSNFDYNFDDQNIVYKLTPGGSFKVLYTLPALEFFSCPNHEPVLAADGNLYGIIVEGPSGSTGGAIYRVAPDETFAIMHEFDAATDGIPSTPLAIGPDGALYGVSLLHNGPNYTMYRMSLDGQFTNLAAFDPGTFSIKQKLTLMPDGYFYGSASISGGGYEEARFRLSPTGEYTLLYENPGEVPSAMIRGFDNALYGTDGYAGKYNGGVLFRYVPPPVQ